jgi:hypothetical protein
VRVEGLNETIRALEKAGIGVNDLKDVMHKISAEGAKLARGFAPVLTGRLRRSIRAGRSKQRAVVRAGGAKVKYAAPINYGWRARGISPSEYMQRADIELKPRVVALLEEGLTEIIEKEGLT